MRFVNTSFCLLATLLGATSCDSFNDSPSSSEAKVNFRLVDAPAEYDEVWVEVLALRVKADYDSSEMTDNDDTWTEITYDGPQMVNLLDLTGGNSILLGTENFPEGEIDQIRLILGDNNYLVQDGQEIELTTPSAQQSGLKIQVDQEVQGGQTYDLVIDFDVAKSIVTSGNSGNVILKPVLRAYLDESQGIQGQVFPLEAHPIEISVTAPGIEFNTFADQEGNFSLMGLLPGTYTITFTPQPPYLAESLPVTVVEDEVTTLEVITLEAQP